MNKKKLANLIMVLLIVLIAAGGVLLAGHLRGWFDTPQEGGFVLSEVQGVVTLTRDGLAFSPDSGTALREGDVLATGAGGYATVTAEDGTIVLNRSAELTVMDGALNLTAGEAFVTQGQTALTVLLDTQTLHIQNAAIHLSMRAGAQSAGVFAGTLEDAVAGQRINWVGDERTVNQMELAALNSFAMAQIRSSEITLCFTAADLDRLEEERRKELESLINDASKDNSEPTEPGETGGTTPITPPTEHTDFTAPTGSPTQPTEPTEAGQPTAPTKPSPTSPSETTKPTPAPTPAPTEPTEPQENFCYITIRCDTILNNLEDLKPGKLEFVPADGTILQVVRVSFTQGETVFEVLCRACEAANIQIEYSWTPMYNSYYIEGINHLYEFDCGVESGWMYRVNGWFPNYGCSSYYLEQGDVIEWLYTCKGLGEDVGHPGGDW